MSTLRRDRNRRRYPRLDAPPGLAPARPEVFHRFLDISIGGMRVLSGRDWKAGDLFELEIRFPLGAPLSATVEVVWTRRVEFEASITNEVGLRFTDLSDYDRSRIASLLAARSQAP